MGYVIGKRKTVKRRVEFEVATDDGAPPERADFVVELRLRDRKYWRERVAKASAEIERLQSDMRQPGAEYSDVIERALEMQDFVMQFQFIREDVVGIEGILDAKGKAVKYTPALLERVLADHDASEALRAVWAKLNRVDAYREELQKN